VNQLNWKIYPGSLCMVGGFLHNPKKIKGIGIIIKEAHIDFGYGLITEEWVVFVDGNIVTLDAKTLWPVKLE